MEEKVIEVDEAFLSTCATGTLTSRVLNEDWSLHKSILLRFPVSSLSKCQREGGPTIFLVPEYTLPCLLEDLLSLQARGVRVRVETYPVD